VSVLIALGTSAFARMSIKQSIKPTRATLRRLEHLGAEIY
jgi:hypothetical protein